VPEIPQIVALPDASYFGFSYQFVKKACEFDVIILSVFVEDVGVTYEKDQSGKPVLKRAVISESLYLQVARTERKIVSSAS